MGGGGEGATAGTMEVVLGRAEQSQHLAGRGLQTDRYSTSMYSCLQKIQPAVSDLQPLHLRERWGGGELRPVRDPGPQAKSY